ncbi:MAG TPA: hypothetical protein VMA30_16660 [Xanthobacteraceae bacterium]|nr:hypothetical protein [Xanthobacteraceae bacterium]
MTWEANARQFDLFAMTRDSFLKSDKDQMKLARQGCPATAPMKTTLKSSTFRCSMPVRVNLCNSVHLRAILRRIESSVRRFLIFLCAALIRREGEGDKKLAPGLVCLP